MTPITSILLAAKEDGDSIPCVEGVLTKLRDRKTGAGDFGEWALQGGSIKLDDGAFSDIVFKDREDMEALKGKRIRITCHETDKGKKTGITMKQKKKGDKVYREINITPSATLTHFEEGAEKATRASDVSGPSDRANPPQNRPQTQGSGHQAGGLTSVRQRVYDYFKVMDVVQMGHKSLLEKGLDLPAELSPSDIKEITTGICMSYKEGYIFHAPVFDEPAPQSTEAPKASAPNGDDGWPPESEMEPTPPVQEKPKLPKWEDHHHPGLGKTLGEADSATKGRMAAWCITNPRPTDGDEEWLDGDVEARHLWGQLNLMIGSLGWNSRKILGNMLAQHKSSGSFNEDVYAAFLKGLSEEDALKKLHDVDACAEEVIALAKKPKKASLPV